MTPPPFLWLEDDEVLILVTVIFIVQVIFGFFAKRDPYEIHNIFCLYAVALGSTFIITEVLKRYVGRLRPNFYEYCGFQTSTLECTNTSKKQDWRMSFPSGHSSTVFCTCVLFVRYTWAYVSAKYTDPINRRPWLMLSLSPLLIAYFVAASRVYDNYHFVGDGKKGSKHSILAFIAFFHFFFSFVLQHLFIR
jgi:diacylglycerol diphosphate phosphatase/phosphatidate phosphatase